MAPQNMQSQPAHHQHQSGRKKKCCSGRRHRSPKKFLVFPVENIQCQLGSGAADKGRLVTGGLPRLTNQDWHWKSSKEAVALSPTVCIAQPQKMGEKTQQKAVQDEEDAETIHAGSAVLITLNKCEDESKDTKKADDLSYCCKKNEATGSSPKQQKNAASRESVEVPNVVKPMWTAPQPPVKAKMILLGESGVGKTSLVYAYKYGSELLPCKPTIGAHYANFELQSTTTVQLQLWDTAGQERFRSMVPMYLRGVGVALLVYDITSRHSFDQLEHWIKELTRCSAMGQPDPLLLLVGNKLDRDGEREVHHEEGKAKASQLGAHFFELSAVDIAGVRRIFQSVADQLAERNCQQFDGAQEVDERTKLGEWETPMEEWQQQQQGSVLRLDRRLLGDLQEWTRLWKRVNAAAAGSSNCCSTQ